MNEHLDIEPIVFLSEHLRDRLWIRPARSHFDFGNNLRRINRLPRTVIFFEPG